MDLAGTGQLTRDLSTPPPRAKNLWRAPLFGLLLVGLIAAGLRLDLGQRLGELREWIEGLGAAGFWVFILIYVVSVVLAVPGTALTLIAGALFGSILGVAAVSIGSTLGAGLAFLVSRYLARDAVQRWLQRSERFQRLDRMTEEHGPIIVAIVRLVPLFPFNLINYGLGLTRVGFWTYLLWSWLFMLPGTVLYVVGSDAIASGIEEGRVPWPLVGIVAVVALGLFFAVRTARKRLDKRSASGAES